MIVSGKELSDRLKSRMAEEVATFPAKYGRVPNLTVILVGDDPASQSYVKGKAKAAHVVGIEGVTVHLPESTSQEELLHLIHSLNDNDKVDGILVQLPLPDHIDEDAIIQAIDVTKDVDGFHSANVAALWQHQDCIKPCTPQGVMRVLEDNAVSLEGKRAVVVGRSTIVGLPMAKMLLDANATVTLAHSHTKNLEAITSEADILVVAVGKPSVIDGSMVKEGAVVMDVGVNRNPVTGKLCGDCDFESVSPKASIITPVPGGIGPMTICCLMENTIKCFLKRVGAAK